MTVAAHNMLQRLLCGEKTSLSSFCPPYGTIVVVMLHEAAPLQSLLPALLVENKLLVSQGKQEARGHRGMWDVGLVHAWRLGFSRRSASSQLEKCNELSEQGRENSATQ